jgi:hypothetical protein
LCRDVCAVSPYGVGDEFGVGGHVWLERVAEGLGQRLGGGCAGRVRGSDSEVLDSLCEVGLVVHLRDDDLRRSSAGGRGRCPGAAVVHDRGDPPEQRLLIDLADGQAVGFAVHEGQVGPTLEHDRAATERAGRLDHGAAELLRRTDTAESEVDGRFARFEERFQLARQWTGVR